MLRLLIISCLVVFSCVSSVTASNEDDIEVKDVTPEMLAKTLPPTATQDEQSAEESNDGIEVEDVTSEMVESTLPQNNDGASASTIANAPVKSADPTLSQLIQTLENDAARKNLVDSLKALLPATEGSIQQFVFVNAFINIKNFLKSVVAESKSFAQALVKKETWTFGLNRSLVDTFNAQKSLYLIYSMIAALFLQSLIAVVIRGGIPPFFGRLDVDTTGKTLIRTLIPLFVFLLVAYTGKVYFIKSPELQVLGEEVIFSISILQLALILLRVSISTGILPVNPEFRKSLFNFLIMLFSLLGVYTLANNFVTFPVINASANKPLSQLFWAVIAALSAGGVMRYRHVIEGMLFRKIPLGENRFLLGVQQTISGSLHYIIIVGILMTYLAWFVQNQAVFGYLRDQLVVTLSILFGLSIVSYLMASSATYLALPPEQTARIAVVTHRLIDGLALISVVYIVYRWIVPLVEMQGVSTSKFSDKLFGIFIIIGLTIFVTHVLNRIFNSQILIAKGNQHLKTFLPMIERLSKLAVFAISVLLLLSELGVNILPIVASFSVLGLGIGLASKSIIEDFINGLFIIQENDFNIGDNVTLGGITGTIENITLRKIHLRDNQGFINFIPFSEVGAIINRSRGFNAEKVDIPLPSAFHLKRTISILEDVGQQLLHDPHLKNYIIGAPKFVGISEFQTSSHPVAEVSTIMQFEIKTEPGKLTLVAGEFRKLAKLAFEEMQRIM